MLLVIKVLPDIPTSIGPPILSLAMLEPILILALVAAAILPFLFAVAMLPVVLPLTLKSAAVELMDAEAVGFIIIELPLVDISLPVD